MIYRIVVCNGNGPGTDIYGPDAEMAVLNPHLEIELNSAGSLEFTLPVENMNWNVPNVFQNEIEVWEDDKIIWFGRPLQIIRDWNNQRRVVCEGALSYFNDSIQRTWEQQPATNKTNISFFRHLINGHNNDVMNNKNFIADNITIESTPAYRKTDYDTTLDCLQNMCLAVDGGYFILRKEYIWDVVRQKDVAQRYIDWYEELPENAMQDVQFGINLLDISQDLNGADICTVLIVSGKDDVMLNELGNKNPDTNNGVGHDSGSDEIYYAPGVATYGRIVQQKSWNDYSDINELWRKAKTWMIEKNTDIPTIECSAADLYYINDPDMVVDGPLQVGMKVQVVSAPHDFNKQLLMYKISMDLDSGVKKVTLGTPPKKELTDIVAPSSGGSSTSGGKGAAGGSSESGSGSGSGSQTVIAPVQDVKVKWPDTDVYTSVVKKKTAKIDLTEVGKVLDVKVDGTSVVSNKVANITIPVKGVKQDGSSVVDENGIANIEVPVKDVKVDGQTVVDANGFAQLLSNDFGRVKGVLVNGTSVVNPETGIATLNGYVDGYQVTFDYMHHIYYWQKQIVIPSGENWYIQDSDIKSRINATYYPETKSLNFDLTDVFQRAITWGPGFDSFYVNLGSDPAYHDLDDKVDGNYVVYARFHYDGFRINDDGIGLDVEDYEYKNDLVRKYFKLDFLSGAGIDIKASSDRSMSTYKYADTEGFHIKISSTEAKSKPHCEEEFHDYSEYPEGSNSDSVSHLISESGTYAILFISAYTSTQEIVFENLSGSTVTPTTTYYNYSNTFSVPGESGKGGKCITIVCDLEAGTVVKFNRTKSSGYKENIVLRSITSLSNVSMATADILISRDNYTKTLTRSSSSDAHTNRSTSYADIGSVNICGSIAFDCADSSSAYVKTTAKTTQYHLDPQYYYDRDPFSITTYNRSDSSKIDASVVYDNGPVGSSRDWNDAKRASCDSFSCSANNLATNNDKAYIFQFFVTLKATKYDDSNVGYVTETEMTDAINDAVSTLESNFQDGVDAIYDACVAKGSTPASQSLSDVVQGIMDIPQSGGGGDTIKFISSSQKNSDFVVVSATSTWDATGLSFTSEVST